MLQTLPLFCASRLYFAALKLLGFDEGVEGLGDALEAKGWGCLQNWCEPDPNRYGEGWADPCHPTGDTASAFLVHLIKSIVDGGVEVAGRTIYVIGDSTLSHHFDEWLEVDGTWVFTYNYEARKHWCDQIAHEFKCSLHIAAVPSSKFYWTEFSDLTIQSQLVRSEEFFNSPDDSPIVLMVGGWNERLPGNSYYSAAQWAEWCAEQVTPCVAPDA